MEFIIVILILLILYAIGSFSKETKTDIVGGIFLLLCFASIFLVGKI